MTSDISAPRERAACIILDRGRVLLMHRRRHGDEYFVVPGGGVEPGESPEEACLRELAEETSLAATHVTLVRTETTGADCTHYFLVEDPSGQVRLGGPEAARHRPDNSYQFRWVDLEAMGTIPLRPASAAAVITHAAHLATITPDVRWYEQRG